jgi:hypothetical protein
VAKDKEAKFGCKENSKFYFGHKAHVSVDMEFVMINKVATTQTNVTYESKMKRICPSRRAICVDKEYCAPARIAAVRLRIHKIGESMLTGESHSYRQVFTPIGGSIPTGEFIPRLRTHNAR